MGENRFVARAGDFVNQQFPQAAAAFLGGSAATGTATQSSDLDVLVILPDPWEDVSFVETSSHEGQLVEAFVYGQAALPKWLDRGRAQHRPVVDRLIAEGLPLTDTELTTELARQSREVIAAGPGAADAEELQRRRYSLSSGIDDLVDRLGADTRDPGETAVLAWTVWREAAELSLLISREWLGTGKWLLRELRRGDDRFGLAAWAGSGGGGTGSLVTCAQEVLAAAGGYVQEGFIRGERPPDL